MNKAASVVLAVLLMAPAAFAAERTIAVTGVGQVQAVPNVASVSLTFTGNTMTENQGVTNTVSVAQVTEQVNARVAPAVEQIKSIVGSNGNVSVTSSVQPRYEYDRQKQENVFKGHTLTTLVSVTLRGQEAVEKRLGQLFDSSKIQADSVSSPVLGLSDRSRAAAKRRAYAKAVADAQNEANAQLLPGETLGKAIHRGNTAAPARAGGARMMAMAAAAPESAMGGSQAATEVGKITVSASSSFLFQVK